MSADDPAVGTADTEDNGFGADAAGDGASLEDDPMVGERHERVDLPVVTPAVGRDEVESTGRVGAVAYPYRVYEATVEIPRPLLAPDERRRVVSVDCSRRLALRADDRPAFETRTVEDALVLPSELSPKQADEKARDAVFRWTTRTVVPSDVPEVTLDEVTDAYKLFWLAERPDGDVIVDSVRGTERALDG